ncbi:hypothetical protein AZI86_11725 [Bdellovibrio bacteriovorus]|uniref:PilZ domain-containing protein n=1 Tax=Bdellovibrio bacteriovorus TaxID=959 RepID=A0A150WM12_BDEBC|nr:PilZ domain-containing protein [Bdellovibrio bacteriovorus]KYG64865.1 hypothetical protein AZI86_11725 [Bdellovibrio bacteriovorus]
MQLTMVKHVVYLNSSQVLPPYLEGLMGVRWLFAKDPREFRQILAKQPGELIVIVKADFLGVRTAETLSSWAQSHPRLSFIFVVQAIEKAAYQVSLNQPKWLFVYESEGPRLTEIITRRIQGKSTKSRRHERVQVRAPVMLKKSMTADKAPQGGKVQFLKEGEMQDFSQGGAKVALDSTGVKVKDFVSLMYRNSAGRWVSIESQVRWVVSMASGKQVIGVQFLAVSA